MVKNILVLILFSAIFIGCNKNADVDCESYDYSSCNTEEPMEGILNIIVTKQNDSSEIPLSVYKGKYGEPGTLIYSDTVVEVETKFLLQLNEDYYAIAKYNKSGNTIYAVDGTFFKKTGQVTCDSTCWKIKGSEIDLRLKN